LAVASPPVAAPTVTETEAPTGLTREQVAHGFTLLAICTFFMTLALNTFDSISSNFYRDSLGMDGALNGYLIAIREVPGFLLIFVAAVMLRRGLAQATGISLLIAGVGFAAIGLTHSFAQVILPVLIASVGYHSWLQLQYALGLSLARNGEEGATLGKLAGIGFLGSSVSLVAVLAVLWGSEWLTAGDHQDTILRIFWFITGAAALVGAAAIWRFPQAPGDRSAAQAAPRITWRKEYWLYYTLATLDGSRQQIYFAFAPFVLVERFDVPARALLVVLLIGAIIKWLMGPVIGRAVDRYGEKRILNVAYLLHLGLFLGFAFAPSVWVAYVLYLGYNFTFLFSIGTTTYIKKICRPQDLAPSLAMGVSLAHVTAIVVPVFGAALWETLGYRFPFLFGTLFVLASLYFTQKIDIARQRIPDAATA
jgi:hypothetical protein